MEFQESCEEVGLRPGQNSAIAIVEDQPVCISMAMRRVLEAQSTSKQQRAAQVSQETPQPAHTVVEPDPMEVGNLERKGSHRRQRSIPTTTLSLRSCTDV
jgi:hypothetical protein